MNPTEIVVAVAGAVALVGYAAFILPSAWSSYARLWERLAASVLTLFILVALLGLGAVLGLAIFWSYDTFV